MRPNSVFTNEHVNMGKNPSLQKTKTTLRAKQPTGAIPLARQCILGLHSSKSIHLHSHVFRIIRMKFWWTVHGCHNCGPGKVMRLDGWGKTIETKRNVVKQRSGGKNSRRQLSLTKYLAVGVFCHCFLAPPFQTESSTKYNLVADLSTKLILKTGEICHESNPSPCGRKSHSSGQNTQKGQLRTKHPEINKQMAATGSEPNGWEWRRIYGPHARRQIMGSCVRDSQPKNDTSGRGGPGRHIRNE